MTIYVVEIEIIFILNYEVIDLNVDKYINYSISSQLENEMFVYDTGKTLRKDNGEYCGYQSFGSHQSVVCIGIPVGLCSIATSAL